MKLIQLGLNCNVSMIQTEPKVLYISFIKLKLRPELKNLNYVFCNKSDCERLNKWKADSGFLRRRKWNTQWLDNPDFVKLNRFYPRWVPTKFEWILKLIIIHYLYFVISRKINRLIYHLILKGLNFCKMKLFSLKILGLTS